MQTRRIYLAFHLQCIDSALEREKENIYVADFTRLISHGNTSTFYKTYFRDYSDTDTKQSLFPSVLRSGNKKNIYIISIKQRNCGHKILFHLAEIAKSKIVVCNSSSYFLTISFFLFFFFGSTYAEYREANSKICFFIHS